MCGSRPVTLSSGTPMTSWKPSPFQARTARPANSESAFTNPSSRNTGANRGRERISSPSRNRSAEPTMNATSSWLSPPLFSPRVRYVDFSSPVSRS